MSRSRSPAGRHGHPVGTSSSSQPSLSPPLLRLLPPHSECQLQQPSEQGELSPNTIAQIRQMDGLPVEQGELALELMFDDLIIRTIGPEGYKENFPKCWVCGRSFLREVGKRLPRVTGCPHLMCGSHTCLNRAHCQWLDVKQARQECEADLQAGRNGCAPTDKLEAASRQDVAHVSRDCFLCTV